VNEFAALVGDRMHLDYLYLLTVADIRATNPNLWNSWKDALLKELHSATRYALERGLERPIEEEEHVLGTQAEARALLADRGVDEQQVDALWRNPTPDYFLYHSPKEIAWHTEAIARCDAGDLPLVLVKALEHRGSTEIFLYGPDQPHEFAIVTSALEQLGLTIVDARIVTSRNGYTLDTFLVLEASGEAIKNGFRLEEIQATLRERLVHPERYDTTVSRRPPRQLKHFDIPTEVRFEQDPNNARTIMKVTTPDRPGLLSRVGKAFTRHGINLQGARASTIGATAQDVFYITDAGMRPIEDPAQLDELRRSIEESLRE
jgi:[protein-PII] uridylyltransferase